MSVIRNLVNFPNLKVGNASCSLQLSIVRVVTLQNFATSFLVSKCFSIIELAICELSRK